jgi:hypothetical protein
MGTVRRNDEDVFDVVFLVSLSVDGEGDTEGEVGWEKGWGLTANS